MILEGELTVLSFYLNVFAQHGHSFGLIEFTRIYIRFRRFKRVHFYCLILELKLNLVNPWRASSSTPDIGDGAF